MKFSLLSIHKKVHNCPTILRVIQLHGFKTHENQKKFKYRSKYRMGKIKY